MKPFNKYFDHTLLKPQATADDIKRLCEEARHYDFYSVCVNSCYVSLATAQLADTDVGVTAVVGFPLGAMETTSKAYEADMACDNGANEIDMVINIGAMKGGDYDYVENDIAAVSDVAYEHDALLKVILETYLLTDEEIRKACRLTVDASASFVKTCTGFNGGQATAEDVALMKKAVGNEARVKASGGIHDLSRTMALIDAGADRIGASASVAIMKEYLAAREIKV